MIVDCDHCEVRGDACGDCVITVLLGAPPGGVELDGTERRALDTLAAAGLVPRLRLVGGRHPRDDHDRDADRHGAPSDDSSAERSAGDAERSSRQVG